MLGFLKGLSSHFCRSIYDGLAQTFILGKEFIGNDNVTLLLVDNIFFGYGFSGFLMDSVKSVEQYGKANIFGYYVNDPHRYRVAEVN